MYVCTHTCESAEEEEFWGWLFWVEEGGPSPPYPFLLRALVERERRARAANNWSLPSLLGLCTHAMQGGKREINREGSDEDIYFWQKSLCNPVKRKKSAEKKDMKIQKNKRTILIFFTISIPPTPLLETAVVNFSTSSHHSRFIPPRPSIHYRFLPFSSSIPIHPIPEKRERKGWEVVPPVLQWWIAVWRRRRRRMQGSDFVSVCSPVISLPIHLFLLLLPGPPHTHVHTTDRQTTPSPSHIFSAHLLALKVFSATVLRTSYCACSRFRRNRRSQRYLGL